MTSSSSDQHRVHRPTWTRLLFRHRRHKLKWRLGTGGRTVLNTVWAATARRVADRRPGGGNAGGEADTGAAERRSAEAPRPPRARPGVSGGAVYWRLLSGQRLTGELAAPRLVRERCGHWPRSPKCRGRRVCGLRGRVFDIEFDIERRTGSERQRRAVKRDGGG